MQTVVTRLLLTVCIFADYAFAGSHLWANSRSASPSGNVTLTLSFVEDATSTPLLHLSLADGGPFPITVVTGIKMGNADYPAANFTFALHFKDGHQVEIFCTSCGPGLIGGTGGPYTVTLVPGKSFNVDIPLADLRIAYEQPVCNSPPSDGESLIVTLDRSLSTDGIDTHHAPIIPDDSWKGRAVGTVALSCGSSIH